MTLKLRGREKCPLGFEGKRDEAAELHCIPRRPALATLLAQLPMPIGSHHEETGILVRDGERLYLQRDAGGHWELDAPGQALALLGHRVRVIGVRTAFDRLTTKQVTSL